MSARRDGIIRAIERVRQYEPSKELKYVGKLAVDALNAAAAVVATGAASSPPTDATTAAAASSPASGVAAAPPASPAEKPALGVAAELFAADTVNLVVHFARLVAFGLAASGVQRNPRLAEAVLDLLTALMSDGFVPLNAALPPPAIVIPSHVTEGIFSRMLNFGRGGATPAVAPPAAPATAGGGGEAAAEQHADPSAAAAATGSGVPVPLFASLASAVLCIVVGGHHQQQLSETQFTVPVTLFQLPEPVLHSLVAAVGAASAPEVTTTLDASLVVVRRSPDAPSRGPWLLAGVLTLFALATRGAGGAVGGGGAGSGGGGGGNAAAGVQPLVATHARAVLGTILTRLSQRVEQNSLGGPAASDSRAATDVASPAAAIASASATQEGALLSTPATVPVSIVAAGDSAPRATVAALPLHRDVADVVRALCAAVACVDAGSVALPMPPPTATHLHPPAPATAASSPSTTMVAQHSGIIAAPPLGRATAQQQSAFGTGGGGSSGGGGGGAASPQDAARSFAISLLLQLVVNGGPAFRKSPAVQCCVKFILFPTLLDAAGSLDPDVFRLALRVLALLCVEFREVLLAETATFFHHVLFRVLDSRHATVPQKALALEVLRSFSNEPQHLVNTFLNYDCDAHSRNVYESIVEHLRALASCGAELSPALRDVVDNGSGTVPAAAAATVALAVPTTARPRDVPAELRRGALAALVDVASAHLQWIERFEDSAAGAAAATASLSRAGTPQRDGEDDDAEDASRQAAAAAAAAAAAVDAASDGAARHRRTFSVGRGGGDDETTADSAAAATTAATAPHASSATTFAEAKKNKLLLERFLGLFNGAHQADAAIAFLMSPSVAERLLHLPHVSPQPEQAASAASPSSSATPAPPPATTPVAEERVATFLHEHDDALDKLVLGEYFAKAFRKELSRAIFEAWVAQHRFGGLLLDEALRLFLGGFKLLGEAQVVDRTMEIFAAHYCAQNPQAFTSANTAYVLSFSICMLNTDAHNPHVKEKMSLEGFLRNNRAIDDGADLDEELLRGIYQRVTSNEIRLRPSPLAAAMAGGSVALAAAAAKSGAKSGPAAAAASGVALLESIPILKHLVPIASAITESVMIPVDAAGNALFNTAARKASEEYRAEFRAALKDALTSLHAQQATTGSTGAAAATAAGGADSGGKAADTTPVTRTPTTMMPPMSRAFVNADSVEHAIPMWDVSAGLVIGALVQALEECTALEYGGGGGGAGTTLPQQQPQQQPAAVTAAVSGQLEFGTLSSTSTTPTASASPSAAPFTPSVAGAAAAPAGAAGAPQPSSASRLSDADLPLILDGIAKALHVCAALGNTRQAEYAVDALFRCSHVAQTLRVRKKSTVASAVTIKFALPARNLRCAATLLQVFADVGHHFPASMWTTAYMLASHIDALANECGGARRSSGLSATAQVWLRARRESRLPDVKPAAAVDAATPPLQPPAMVQSPAADFTPVRAAASGGVPNASLASGSAAGTFINATGSTASLLTAAAAPATSAAAAAPSSSLAMAVYHQQQDAMRDAMLSALSSMCDFEGLLDRLYDATRHVSQAQLQMVNGLVQVCDREVQVGRLFSLQQLCEFVTTGVASATRMQWRDMWANASKVLILAGTHERDDVAVAAVEGFKMVAFAYLQREELSLYSFQRELLRPLETMLMRNSSGVARRAILDAVAQIVDLRAQQLASGWAVVLSCLSRFAFLPNLTEESWATLLRLVLTSAPTLPRLVDHGAELIFCLTSFSCNTGSEPVALHAGAFLEACALWLQQGLVAPPLDAAETPLGVHGWVASRVAPAAADAAAAVDVSVSPKYTNASNSVTFGASSLSQILRFAPSREPLSVADRLRKPAEGSGRTEYHLWLALLEGMMPIAIAHNSLRVRCHIIAVAWTLLARYAPFFDGPVCDALFSGTIRPVLASLCSESELLSPSAREPLSSVGSGDDVDRTAAAASSTPNGMTMLLGVWMDGMTRACRGNEQLLGLACATLRACANATRNLADGGAREVAAALMSAAHSLLGTEVFFFAPLAAASTVADGDSSTSSRLHGWMAAAVEASRRDRAAMSAAAATGGWPETAFLVTALNDDNATSLFAPLAPERVRQCVSEPLRLAIVDALLPALALAAAVPGAALNVGAVLASTLRELAILAGAAHDSRNVAGDAHAWVEALVAAGATARLATSVHAPCEILRVAVLGAVEIAFATARAAAAGLSDAADDAVLARSLATLSGARRECVRGALALLQTSAAEALADSRGDAPLLFGDAYWSIAERGAAAAMAKLRTATSEVGLTAAAFASALVTLRVALQASTAPSSVPPPLSGVDVAELVRGAPSLPSPFEERSAAGMLAAVALAALGRPAADAALSGPPTSVLLSAAILAKLGGAT